MKRKFNPYIVPVKTASNQDFLLSSYKTKSDKSPGPWNFEKCEVVKKPGHFHFSDCETPAKPPGWPWP